MTTIKSTFAAIALFAAGFAGETAIQVVMAPAGKATICEHHHPQTTEASEAHPAPDSDSAQLTRPEWRAVETHR